MSRAAHPKGGAGPARLKGVEAAVRGARGKGPAPVHLWNPPYCGEIGLAIAADGSWSYQGSPIRRRALMDLFASVLRKDEDGRHYLVTPVEKIGIDVADAPFLAVAMTIEGQGPAQTLTFRTNLDEAVRADSQHPLRFARDPDNDGLRPYVLVRGRLEARLTRALAYDLVSLAMAQADEGRGLGVWSGGAFFPMAGADGVGSG
jgi:hypothetical protein